MDGELQHHGIKGQRWGVRRTPAQLGHAPKGSKLKKAANTVKKKLTERKSKSSESMSDEELRNRINRLNMEEQYSNLLARQKDRDTSKFRKMIGSAFESLAKKGFDYAVDWAFKKIFDKDDPDDALRKEVERLRNEDAREELLEKKRKRNSVDPDEDLRKEVDHLRLEDSKRELLDKQQPKPKFDIDQWKTKSVDEMDAETITKVASWYESAAKIRKGRSGR